MVFRHHVFKNRKVTLVSGKSTPRWEIELEGGAQAMVEFSSEQIALENYTKNPTLEVCQLSKVVINDMFNIHISLCSHVIFIYLHIYSQRTRFTLSL